MSQNESIHNVVNSEYALGFTTDIESDTAPKGLNKNILDYISQKKDEPQWMLQKRYKALDLWLKMKEPNWAHLNYPPIDYQAISYYSAPKKKLDSLDEVDPQILQTYEKLGIPLEEQKLLAGVAVDAVFDSVSVKTTFEKAVK